MRLAWSGFEEWLETYHAEALPKFNDTIRVLYEIRQNVCNATHDAAMNDESCQKILDLFLTYLNVLRHERDHLSAFWMTYVEMVDILLGLLRADREGDWPLHLACIRKTCPGLHAHFLHGGFSVQLRNGNPFARIAVDQTTEESVNTDTQTAGGTCGFSLKPGAVSRYYLTAEYRAGALRQLRQEISTQGHGATKHTDLEKTRIKQD
ncbi:hypothetical protein GQR58_019897 [Nymphon striatum]|nr:hypothetical protein GQR58_019897 [Nymphon striatum]